MRITSSHFVPGISKFPIPVNPRAKGPPYPVPTSPRGNPWPILFYDQVAVQSGGEQEFRSQNFTNNTGRPIEFHSLRVVVSLLSAAAYPTVLGGGVIALAIAVDGVPVTRGPIPVWNLCRSDNRENDSFTNGITNYALYFAQPVPLLPGKTITIQAKHLGVIAYGANVAVSLAGRVSKSAIPNRIPFISSWSSRAFGYNEAAIDSAPPAALLNDSGRDLHVVRIIGRSVAYDDASLGAGAANTEFRDFDDVSLQGVTSFRIRMGISQDRPILKTFTPWRTVFGQNSTVETAFDLKPGDYLSADVQHIAGPVLATPFVYSQNRGSLSIIGWRDV